MTRALEDTMPRFAAGAELVQMISQSGQTLSAKEQSSFLERFAVEADEFQLQECLRYLDEVAPPLDFVAAAGVVACGAFCGRGDLQKAAAIRRAAGHQSARMRDAAVQALILCGRISRKALLELARSWEDPDLHEERCLVLGLSDVELMDDPEFVAAVLDILDRIMEDLERGSQARGEDYKNLKKTVAYSLANPVAALPAKGKMLFEQWMRIPSADVRWVLLESLKRSRLVQMDRAWVEQQIEFLSSGE